jgi:phosphoribosylformimino-5-aminoimidazole carboxamide ribotide isomerase
VSLQILPSIDLRDGRVVRLQQGDYARQIDYPVDALEVARNYQNAGAKWLHVVDLDGAKVGRVVQLDQIALLCKLPGLTVQAGGGVRSETDIRALIDAGVSRVVVGTKALADWEWFRGFVHRPEFAGKLVLAIDAREGVIATHGWQESSGKLAVDVAREVTDWPLASLLYTDVARDGMLGGPNVERTTELALASRVPVIASGGVGRIDHVTQLIGTPIWGCIVGRALYEGKVDLKLLLAECDAR